MASMEGGGHPTMHHEGTVTSLDVSGRDDVEKLKGGSLNLLGVLFLCVTGSAPLAVFMFNFPFSVGAGNEFGTPAGFLFATVVLASFFSLISRWSSSSLAQLSANGPPK